ncbi:MAG: 16S rRNA methyltransferase, partial [Planctomycetes bacterium]|nr:16S rRNA methyltransferase [Planctomycetota bacterium]
NGGGRTGGKSPSGSLKCVSNLPYSAGTPFVLNLLSSPLPWSLGVFLLQLEVGERLIAAPGSREYGDLSIAARLAAQTTIERVVSPRAFWPRPKVDSAVVRMEFLPVAERTALPWRALRAVTRAVFGSRRKILRNAFKDLAQPQDPTALLRQAGLDPEGRGENLRPDEFLGLARLVSSRPDSEWEE